MLIAGIFFGILDVVVLWSCLSSASKGDEIIEQAWNNREDELDESSY